MVANLVSVEELRALVPSPLDDVRLTAVVARVEAEVTEMIGVPYAEGSDISKRVEGGHVNIFMERPIGSVTSITEYNLLSDATGESLTEGTDYFVWADEGRIERIGISSCRSAPSVSDVFCMSDAQFESGRGGAGWGQRVEVVYRPADQTGRRKQAIIDLVRIILAHTAMRRENVGHEYQYEAPANWEDEKVRVLRRLRFVAV